MRKCWIVCSLLYSMLHNVLYQYLGMKRMTIRIKGVTESLWPAIVEFTLPLKGSERYEMSPISVGMQFLARI